MLGTVPPPLESLRCGHCCGDQYDPLKLPTLVDRKWEGGADHDHVRDWYVVRYPLLNVSVN